MKNGVLVLRFVQREIHPHSAKGRWISSQKVLDSQSCEQILLVTVEKGSKWLSLNLSLSLT
jgi:hypothetical protein